MNLNKFKYYISRKSKCKQAAFTLIEVMISLSIISIASLGMAKAFSNQITFNTRNERRSNAVAAAQLVLDRYRTIDPSTLPTSGSFDETVTVGTRTYDVKTRYCEVTSQCSSASIRGLSVEVKFRGEKQIKIATVYAQLR